MEIKRIDHNFTVCKLKDYSAVDLNQEFCFLAKTDEENSLVCLTEHTPEAAEAREDGWRAFRIQGVLDFSLIGILARITALLAGNSIGVFAISTYNTDYILTKSENYQKALDTLARAGYTIL